MHTIDLSVLLNEATPTYEGDPQTKLESVATVAKDGYAFTYLSVNSHTGTHIDAPAHMLPGPTKTLDDYPIESFFGKGLCIDVEKEPFTLETVKQADIQAGDIVLFHSGMSTRYHNPDYYNGYTAMPEDIARYLVNERVKMVGVDMCSVDYEPFTVHRILLTSDVLIIENLTNLDRLVNKRFDIYALPIRVAAVAAPARVIAVLEEET